VAGLPPSARLRRAADFAALRHATGRLSTAHFSLRWIPSAAGQCRLGLAVSRKVSKRAVARNRIKRVIRESFRAQRGGLPPIDVLVIARASAANLENHVLRSDLEGAWQRLQSLKPAPAPGTIGG
jgi:ribonuclease P protein component